MRESLREALRWQALAIVCYLLGMALFLVVVNAYLAPPERSVASLTTGDVLLTLASVALLIAGGFCSRKGGGFGALATGGFGSAVDRGPDQSSLEELGYRVPDDETERTDAAGTVPKDAVRCPDCGRTNDRSFTYCGRCSSRLPDDR